MGIHHNIIIERFRPAATAIDRVIASNAELPVGYIELAKGCLQKKGDYYIKVTFHCQKWIILQVLAHFFVAVQMKIIWKISDFSLGQKWRILG